jgi:hypothetical protein
MSRTILKWLVVVSLGFLFPLALPAQESKPESPKAEKTISVYRLDYVIRELDNGKRINERKYSLSVEVEHGRGKEWGHVRVGRRVPVAVAGTAGGPNPQFTYMDVGLNLDSNLQEQGDGLLLETTVEMSSVVTGGELAAPNVPVTRQARANMASLITPGKPTVIGTLDDVDSTHSYQIEVTATRMK